MAEIIKFSPNYDELMKLSDKAKESKDIPRQVELLKKAIALDPTRGEAKLALFNTYSDLGAADIANGFAFKALNDGLDDDTRELVFIRLAMNFAQMGKEDVAEYYLSEYVENYDVDLSMFPEDNAPNVSLVHGDEYNERLVDRAYDLMRDHRFDDAIALMDRVDDDSSVKDTANQIVLIALMLKRDMDAVVANAEAMLKKKDSLVVKSTLASAYMAEDKTEEARRIVDGLLETEFTRIDDILLVLPLLINFDLHADIEKYSRHVLSVHNCEIHAMLWLSVALYNLGKKDEALKVIKQIETIYGDNSPASYLKQQFESDVPKAEYIVNLPESECLRRVHILDEMLCMPLKKLGGYLKEDSPKGEEYRAILEWALSEDVEEMAVVVMQKLSLLPCDYVDDLLKKTLLKPRTNYEVFSAALLTLVEEHGPLVRLNAVALDRYKELSFVVPDIYFSAPEPLFNALRFALANIVITDDEPNEFIARLFKIVGDIVPVDSYGEPIKTKRLQKIRRLKSDRTIVGVLLGKVYEDEESKEDVLQRYDLKEQTYDKYVDIFFGDEDDGKD